MQGQSRRVRGVVEEWDTCFNQGSSATYAGFFAHFVIPSCGCRPSTIQRGKRKKLGCRSGTEESRKIRKSMAKVKNIHHKSHAADPLGTTIDPGDPALDCHCRRRGHTAEQLTAEQLTAEITQKGGKGRPLSSRKLQFLSPGRVCGGRNQVCL